MAKPGFYTVDALDPSGSGGSVEALIPKDLLENYFTTHPVTWYNVQVAKEVLEHPARVYHGVREHQAGGWCYSGRPARFWKKVRATVPLPKDRVFAVYMNPHYHVYLWRIEAADPEDPFAPLDWARRYGGVTWTRDS